MRSRIDINTEKHKFENPWVDSSRFLSLGTYQDVQPNAIVHYDLYALIAPEVLTGDLFYAEIGARYGNDGPEYISGTADFGFGYRPTRPLQVATRRLFQYTIKTLNTQQED